MDITPITPKEFNVINGYSSTSFTINEKTYENSLLLSKEQIIEIKLENFLEIAKFDKKILIDQNPEIFLIGTGKNHQIISNKIKSDLKKLFPNSSISEMNTGSACRTYNILISEGRNVLALLTK